MNTLLNCVDEITDTLTAYQNLQEEHEALKAALNDADEQIAALRKQPDAAAKTKTASKGGKCENGVCKMG